MSSERIAVEVHELSKHYQVYAAPRDRLLQHVVPPALRLAQRVARRLGLPSAFPLPKYYREFRALSGVSFQLRQGESLGIIGRNGSGKSTLLQILAGTLAPTRGTRRVDGRVAALLELGSGFNPEFSGRDNVFLNGQILGLTRREVAERYDQIVEFADIGEFVDRPVKTYSTGMFVRLAFAVQAHIDASIIIIDEALAVGDVFFRQKCYARLEELRNSGAAILLVSHSMPEIEQYCDRALLLDRGVPRFLGPSAEATKHYYLLDQAGGANLARLDPAAHAHRPEPGLPAPASAARPPAAAFLDLSRTAPVSNGMARCVGVALCNEAGLPCRVFQQGEVARFHFEFELERHIGVPLCGIVISNERGVIVHGKNSAQYDDVEVPPSRGPGSKVVCQQEIALNLAPGEYTFEIGLASISEADWQARHSMSLDALTAACVRVCHVANVASFSIGLALRNGVRVLTHHGVADLPGRIKIVTIHDTAAARIPRESTLAPTPARARGTGPGG
jgi:lipopolysaccharide transport system ATP-binding protein